MLFGVAIGLGTGHIVLDGDAVPLPQKGGTVPNFRPMYFVQTAGQIKMPLCKKVGLGPGRIVLHGIAAPPKRGTAPSFRFMSIVTKRLDG